MIVDRLKPDWETIPEKVQIDFIISVMNEAGKMGIPLIGDCYYGDNGLGCEFYHYDRLRNFSLSEHQVIEQLIHNRAQLHGGAVTADGYFRWQFRPKTPKPTQKTLMSKLVQDKLSEQLLADYIEALHMAGVKTAGNQSPEEMEADPLAPIHDVANLNWPMYVCPACQVPSSLTDLRSDAKLGYCPKYCDGLNKEG